MASTRATFARKVFAAWWWAIFTVVWTIFSSADTLIGKYATQSFQDSWKASWVHPRWGWEAWIIGLLVITAGAIFEGGYRQYSEQEEKVASLERQLNGPAARAAKCRALLLQGVDNYKHEAGSTDVWFDTNQLKTFAGEYADALPDALDKLTTDGRAKQGAVGVWQID